MRTELLRALEALRRRLPAAEPPPPSQLVGLALLGVALALVVAAGLVEQAREGPGTDAPVADAPVADAPGAEGSPADGSPADGSGGSSGGALADAGVSPCPGPPRAGGSTLLSVVGGEGAAGADRADQDAPGALERLDAGAARSVSARAEQPAAIRWEDAPAVAAWTLDDDAGPPLALACPPAPASGWSVAGFDTTLGAASTLHLANPYSADAVVRVRLLTPEGPRAPVRTEDVLVEAGGQRALDLAELEPGLDDLVAEVTVREGRVVPYGTLAVGSAHARDDAADVLGDADAADLEDLEDPDALGATVLHPVPLGGDDEELVAAGAPRASDARSWVLVANPADEPASFELEDTGPAGAAGGAPDEAGVERTVPAGSTLRLELDELGVPEDAGLAVRPLEGAELIAALLTTTTGVEPTDADEPDEDDADEDDADEDDGDEDDGDEDDGDEDDGDEDDGDEDDEPAGDLVAEPLRPAGVLWGGVGPAAAARHLHLANPSREPATVTVEVGGEPAPGWDEGELPARGAEVVALDVAASREAVVRVDSTDPIAATLVTADEDPVQHRALPTVDLEAFTADPVPALRDPGLPGDLAPAAPGESAEP